MTIRLMLSATFAATVSLALGGCLYFPSRSERDAPPPTYTTPSSPSTYTTQTGEAEMFQGSMGNVTSFTSASPELRISGTSTSTNVRIDGLNTAQGWWAMTSITFSGGLRHPSLVPGAHLTFSNRTPYTSGALRVSAIGCSGPERNRYTFDHSADTTTVDVMEGSEPGRNRMVFTSTYTNNGRPQTVQGSFEYDPR